MLFNSYQFLLVFLPAAILIYGLVDHVPRLRMWTLIALSLVFYGYWDVRFLPLMIGSILVNWWASLIYVKTERHAVIKAAVIGNLLAGPLFGIDTTIQTFNLPGFLVAIVGAIVLLGIVNLVQRGRVR